MPEVGKWVFLTLLVCLLSARAQDDRVNERPPTDRFSMERHWGLDCSATAEEIGALLGDAKAEASLSPEREASIASELARCALLDRREAAGAGPHQELSGAFQRWRKARASSREAERMAARCALSGLLKKEFDLNQGR